MFYFWLISSLTVLFLYFIFQKDDQTPICGVYQKPGKFYHLKYWAFRFLLFLKQRDKKKGPNFEKLDQPQPLSDSPKAFDAVFFMAVTQDGFYIVGGAERRKHNIVNGLLYIAVPGLGLLCSRKIPDTVLFDAEDNTFEAEGLVFQPLEPMKKWKISYNGEMWHHLNPAKRYLVSLSGTWTSDLQVFDYDTDMNSHLVARTIATEPWSVQYFNTLKKAHQCHYEQMGEMSATLTIETQAYTLTNMQAFRDHSFGHERDWGKLHRYVFHMLFLEDGTKAAIGVICQPSSCSMMQAGYLYSPDGQLSALEWCDFRLYHHGESGKPPSDYAFRFQAGGEKYTVKVQVEHESVHYKGWHWEARLVERLVRYKVRGVGREVVSGRGVSEWQYSSFRRRPSTVSVHDPAWFSELVNKY